MGFYIKLYFSALIIFFAVDMVWLGLVARNFYKKHLGFIMSPEVNWYAALIFYALFIAGILVFVVIPGLRNDGLGLMLLKAAFFGLITYATYDLTNLATLKNWPVVVTIVDMIWGMVLTTLVSFGTYYAGRWLEN
jgi:uncharacterized membrane protein